MASLPESPGPEDDAVPRHEGQLHHPSFLLPMLPRGSLLGIDGGPCRSQGPNSSGKRGYLIEPKVR